MGSETTTERDFDAFDNEQITAQDVVDALRLAFMAQKNAVRRAQLADALLDFAPETDSARGTALLLRLIQEGSVTVEMAVEGGSS